MRRTIAAAGFTCALLLAGSSDANWPVARHDPARSGYVPGSSNIVTPGLAWSYYLGGALDANQYWEGNLDGSGRAIIAYTSGGKLIAKLADDTVVWETPPLSLNQLFDVWDIDGDGTLDVLAGGSPAVLEAFNGKTGALEWSMPSAQVGLNLLANVGDANYFGVRTVDLDGDGKRDVYAANQYCISTVIPPCNEAVAYSFAGGFGAAKELWTIGVGASTGYGGVQDLTVDVDGDGTVDIVRVGPAYDQVQAFSGKTGQLEFHSTPGADQSLAWECMFDAAPAPTGNGHIVIYYENQTRSADPSYGGERVLAYGYDASSTSLTKLWELDAGTQPMTDQISYGPSSIGQFDATKQAEVAFSLYDSAKGAWTLDVVNAATGAVVASQPNAVFQGAAVVDATGVSAILATVSGALTVFKLNGSTLQPGATPPYALPLRLDRTQSQAKGIGFVPVTTSIGGTPQVILESGSAGSQTYAAVDVSSAGTGNVVASFQTPTSTRFLTFDTYTDPATMLPQPYLALSSGYLYVLDPSTFLPTNVVGGEFPLLGMKIGGYYTGASDVGPTPVVASLALDAGVVPSVIVPDSRGVLLRLDPGATASVVTPPTPVWTLPGDVGASLVDLNGDDVPEVVMIEGPSVVARLADGKTTLWTSPAVTGGLSYDLPFGDANGDGTPDLFIQSFTSSFTLTVNVVSGKTGAPIWATPFSESIDVGNSVLGIGDLNADGTADAVTSVDYVTVLSGPDGATLGKDPNLIGISEPLLYDVLGAGTPQIYLPAGYFYGRLDTGDGGTVWETDAGEALGQLYDTHLAALAPCPSGPLFVQGERESPVLYALGATTGVQAWNVVLSSGKAYPNEQNVPDAGGAPLGFLGNVTVKQDLMGAGHPDALVGSTDGYLYAVQACTGTLDWAYDFGFPVGEPVLADTIGTGVDQILVSVADGTLYAVNQQAVAQPAYVYAIDPPGHMPVSTIVTTSALYAEWASVAGATSYQWAVFTSGGSMVGTQGYQTVTASSGPVVDVTASNLPLVNGGRYFFAVRAVASGGSSNDVASNTVTVTLGGDDGGLTASDGGPSDAGSVDGGGPSDASVTPDSGHSNASGGKHGGCGCSEAGSDAAAAGGLAGLFFFAPFAALAYRRRRRVM